MTIEPGWYMRWYDVAGFDEDNPKLINPELVKGVRFTFTLHDFECIFPGDCDRWGQACMFMYFRTEDTWHNIFFCYEKQQTDTFMFNKPIQSLELGVSVFYGQADGTVLVEILGENDVVLRRGQQVLGDCDDCGRADCDFCSNDGKWFALGDVNGSGGVDIFDALEILKFIVGMNSTINHGDIQAGARRAARISSTALAQNGNPNIFCALEILKFIVGMDSRVDNVHINGTPS
jgi:hypothetical protein